MAWVMMTHRNVYLLFVGVPKPRICTCTFLFASPFRFFVFRRFWCHRLPFGTGNYLTYLARELPVYLHFSRALTIWPLWGCLCSAERGLLQWQMADVHRAHRNLERGSVTSASRATLRNGLRGAGTRVVQVWYGGRYLLMGAALTTLV